LAEKKALNISRQERRKWIDPADGHLSVVRQCALIEVARSSYYHGGQEGGESEENLRLMRTIDELYLKRPFYGSPRITDWLRDLGWTVNEKRVARLMRLMGLQAVLPGPHTSRRHRGYLYLVAVMDWFSRYVLSWELSNSLDTEFCLIALERALKRATPGIFNTDQGAQFTSEAFTARLENRGIQVSMDGRGRALDNVFIERLWRSVKYEEIYLRDYEHGEAARCRLRRYFRFYNTRRRHQGLGKRTPAQVHFAER
jgi:putative transposase